MEIIPSKTALVQSWTTSPLCRISRNSSQLGQPLLTNLVPVCTMEQTMQARRLRRDMFGRECDVSDLMRRTTRGRVWIDETQVFVKFVDEKGVEVLAHAFHMQSRGMRACYEAEVVAISLPLQGLVSSLNFVCAPPSLDRELVSSYMPLALTTRRKHL